MAWRVLTKHQLEETKKQFAASGYVMQWYAMAMEVILTTLGPEWWKKNCLSTSPKADEFLAITDDSEESGYSHQDRIVKLGHMLYELKDQKGYEAFITSLRTRDLAPTFFELWVANALNQNGFTVEFVEAKGQKGEDYDLHATKSAIVMSVEAKSRRAGVVLGEKTLRNTLETARMQLPASGPSMVFVSIPSEWTIDSNAETVIGNCIDAFFRSSARVNYVILIWHRWIDLNVGKASTSFVRQYENVKARTLVQLGSVIKPVDPPAKLDGERQQFSPSFW